MSRIYISIPHHSIDSPVLNKTQYSPRDKCASLLRRSCICLRTLRPACTSIIYILLTVPSAGKLSYLNLLADQRGTHQVFGASETRDQPLLRLNLFYLRQMLQSSTTCFKRSPSVFSATILNCYNAMRHWPNRVSNIQLLKESPS